MQARPVDDKAAKMTTRSRSMVSAGTSVQISPAQPDFGDDPPYSSRGRSKGPPVCQVEGCGVNLTGLKEYHQRYKICEHHLKVNFNEPLTTLYMRYSAPWGAHLPAPGMMINLAVGSGRRWSVHRSLCRRMSACLSPLLTADVGWQWMTGRLLAACCGLHDHTSSLGSCLAAEVADALLAFCFFSACPQMQLFSVSLPCRCQSLCGMTCASVSASSAAASIIWWSLMGRSAAAGRDCSGTTPGGARKRGMPLLSPPNGRSAGGALQRQLLSRMGFGALTWSALHEAWKLQHGQPSGTGGLSSTGCVCAAAIVFTGSAAGVMHLKTA